MKNLPASSHPASIFPRASPSEICPQRLQAPTKPVRRIAARQPLSLWQPDEAEVDGGHVTSKFVGQRWKRHRRPRPEYYQIGHRFGSSPEDDHFLRFVSVYLKIVPHCPCLNITKFLGSCVDVA